jgi:MerR family redox-sensitive transcriptional activator SoxR
MAEPDDDLLAIGAVAERSGLAVSALRFYETHGLLDSTRTAGGQRRYRRDVLRRLAVIRAAQQVGFTLGDIAGMLAGLPEDHHIDEAGWRALASSWRPQIDKRIRVLERLRDQLDRCIGCGCLSMKTCRMANPGDRAGSRGPGPRYWLAADASATSIATSDRATSDRAEGVGDCDGRPPASR